MEQPIPPLRNAALQTAAVLLAVFIFTRFGGLFSLPPTGISAFWPANALLFSGALLMRDALARTTVLLALPAYFLAEVWIGYPPGNAAIYSLANVAEVAAFLWLLRRASLRSLAFDSIRSLFAFLSLGLLASLVGGGIGAAVATQEGGDFRIVLMRWSLADFFGYCLVAPLVLSWDTWRQFLFLERPGRIAEFVALLAALLLIAALSFGALGLAIPLGAQFLPMPILLWAALRFGPPGGAAATLIVACVAFFSATHGVGLFAMGPPDENVASLQVFFASLVVSVMTIASLNAERRKSFDALWQEVAERREAEEALRQSEARYRRIVATASEGIGVTDTDGRATFVNARMAEMLGYPAEAILGRTMAEFMLDEDLPAYLEMQDQRARGVAENYERRYRRSDGSVVWAHVSATPIMDDAGRFAGSFAMFTDITERKRAERDLLLVSFALDNVREAAFLIDENAHFRFVNEGACHTLGYTREELLGMRVADVDPDFPAARWSDHWRELQAQRSLLFEGRHRSKDGRIFPVEVSANYIEYGQQHFNLALVRDIAERKRTEEELRIYKEQLEETVERRTAELRLARDAAEAASTAKSVFLANMSHELRTPLNAILGFSSMMRSDPQLTAAQVESLDIINRSGEHLLALINDVLEMAKIEAGRVQLEVASFDLGGMIRDVTDLMGLRAEQKGLSLQLDQASEFPRYIRGDEARLRQILVNLVGNAVKFTQEGGVTLRLGVKQNDHQHLLIEVEDSGPGIGPEDQARIFKPFVQLEEGAKQKGTGLGLTITKQFVDLMGGRIVVESSLGKGSLFRVDLPVELADLPPAKQVEQREVEGLVPGQQAYRILIAEDQRDSALLLQRLMSNLGLETKVAENGEQCVRIFQEWHPDLIWMDRRMPVMEGPEAARRIRRLPDGGQVKIVAVTASAFMEQQQEMLDAGMDDFVTKPYRLGEIYDCLARQLGLKYVYRSETAKTQAGPIALTAVALPAALKDELRDALVRLDSERIAALLDQVGDIHRELGDSLSRLAKGFDYPAIQRLLDQVAA